MESLEKIRYEIELLKTEMIYLANSKGIDDPIVVESSQKLDKVLNKYNTLKLQNSTVQA